MSRIAPVLFGPVESQGKVSSGYWKLGEYLGPAWEIGKDLEAG